MARRPNYAFEKNAKAKAKAEKREAKRLAKLAARQEGDATGAEEAPDGEIPAVGVESGEAVPNPTE